MVRLVSAIFFVSGAVDFLTCTASSHKLQNIVEALTGIPEEVWAVDDQCANGDDQCSLNALQLRTVETNSNQSSCLQIGCHGYIPNHWCQCNSKCQRYGNCCPGYAQTCAHHHGSCMQRAHDYTLDWKAEGHSFFKDWTFVTEDQVHGAHAFVNKTEAFGKGVVRAGQHNAKIRIGGIRKPSYKGEAKKRYSVNMHTDRAWDPATGMLVLMDFNHLPYGCGVWPSFWTMNSDRLWPLGGEMDMMEYKNRDVWSLSLHTKEKCKLDKARMEKCKPRRASGTATPNCETDYGHGLLGCRPKHVYDKGYSWARKPGVLAMEWTKTRIVVYMIPRHEIPHDIHSNHPEPSTWSKWVMGYFPFDGPCNSIGPQELVINIQLCGDWAGGKWDTSTCASGAFLYTGSGRCTSGLSQPKDCCTMYVTDPRRDAYFHDQAYFDINYIKVFHGKGSTSKASGTYLRSGAMLHPEDVQ
jgi:hypothetical protein